jgi:hypothetical protein
LNLMDSPTRSLAGEAGLTAKTRTQFAGAAWWACGASLREHPPTKLAAKRLRTVLFRMFRLQLIMTTRLTIKITDERHPGPPELQRDVRAAHSVHRFVRQHDFTV